ALLRTEAITRGPPGVGRLGERGAAVAGEVDPGYADARRERTGGGVTRGGALVVDLVVRASRDDGGVVRVDGDGRLVLLVLGERGRWAPVAHQRSEEGRVG